MEETLKQGIFHRYVVFVILLVLLLLAVMLAGLRFPVEKSGEEERRSYQYRVALLADSDNASFAQEVYLGAAEAGAGQDVMVEIPGSDLVETMSLADAMNMAIYENVDGILVRTDGTDQIADLIDKAVDAGIPVITIQKDVPQSKRQGFVGNNDYFLGREYGRRVLQLAADSPELIQDILVLIPGSSYDSADRTWFALGLEDMTESLDVTISYEIIRTENGLNNAEELLQSLFIGNASLPNILICLDEMTTQSVSRILHGRTQQQPIQIIGNSLTEEIAQAIAAGEIDSSITLDYQELGRISLTELMKYKTYHMVSYYTEIGNQLITQAEAEKYLADKEREDEN